ncbi:MAG TPA: PDZ domain-containing protein, partial [Oscillatoriaceae cyanobacterium]
CFVVGHQEDWPCTLDVDAPLGWRVATGLESTGESTFAAANYEELIDCPLEVGLHELAAFSQDGVDYEVVYEGATPFDPETLVPALKRIVKAATDFWGKPPLKRYVFQYLETNAGFLNGLEHRNSTIITGPVADPAQRTGLLAITAHEFFHLWNVKRLRPVEFGKFDYTREAHTKALWVVEGFTEYFTERLVLRAGLQSGEAYLSVVTNLIQQLEAMPGRRNMSLEEASWTTWHFGDDRWNGALNYYVKGALFGVALDLELRGRSGNRLALDDVMRAMWQSHGSVDKPYRTDEFEACAARLLGEPMDAFFDFHLRGREDYDWAQMLGHAGLELVVRERLATLGATLAPHDGGMRLENVAAGGAAQRAGLTIGDVLVAIDGVRATPALLEELRHQGDAGEVVEVSYFRRDRLHQAPLTLGETRQYAIIAAPSATEAQLAVRADWLAQNAAKAGAAR